VIDELSPEEIVARQASPEIIILIDRVGRQRLECNSLDLQLWRAP
jgi:hypothetical protein